MRIKGSLFASGGTGGGRQGVGIFGYVEALRRNSPHFTEGFLALSRYKRGYGGVTGGYERD
jgi:hypothetical protein